MVKTVSTLALQRRNNPAAPPAFGSGIGQVRARASEQDVSRRVATPSPSLVRVYFGLQVPEVAVQSPILPQGWYGTFYANGETSYRLWAPLAKKVDLLVMKPANPEDSRHVTHTLEERVEKTLPMTGENGTFTYTAGNNSHPPGTLYMYRLTYPDGGTLLRPDPRSFYQPEDVYGPSEVVDLEAFKPETPRDWWKKNEFLQHFPQDSMMRRMIPYRLHVGTFTKDPANGPLQQGSFQSTIEKLDWIKGMGYNAVDIMPVMEFPGRRGWSYDQVQNFAVENAYGRWEDFQRLVDECHKRNLAVILDVCYNHLGPVGNYHGNFDDQFANGQSPVGSRYNWDRGGTDLVLQNLEIWVKKAGVDGFRFDMTPDYGNDEVLKKINRKLKEMSYEEGRPLVAQFFKRPVFSIAEDYRGDDPRLVKELGFNRVYDYDFHHLLEGMTLGDREKLHHFYMFFDRRNPYSHNHYYRYGQSHDEISNPIGEKQYSGQRPITKFRNMNLPHAFDRGVVNALLKYFVPGTPRNFQGEEYGENALFTFFTDKSLCNEGDKAGWRIDGRHDPFDPFSEDAFNVSRLTWNKNPRITSLTQKAIELRKAIPSLWQGDQDEFHIYNGDLNDGVFAMKRWGVENPDDETFIVVNFSDQAYTDKVMLPQGRVGNIAHAEKVEWEEVFNSDDRSFNGPHARKDEKGYGRVNRGRLSSGKIGINLAPWSIVVFRKVPKDG